MNPSRLGSNPAGANPADYSDHSQRQHEEKKVDSGQPSSVKAPHGLSSNFLQPRKTDLGFSRNDSDDYPGFKDTREFKDDREVSRKFGSIRLHLAGRKDTLLTDVGRDRVPVELAGQRDEIVSASDDILKNIKQLEAQIGELRSPSDIAGLEREIGQMSDESPSPGELRRRTLALYDEVEALSSALRTESDLGSLFLPTGNSTGSQTLSAARRDTQKLATYVKTCDGEGVTQKDLSALVREMKKYVNGIMSEAQSAAEGAREHSEGQPTAGLPGGNAGETHPSPLPDLGDNPSQK